MIMMMNNSIVKITLLSKFNINSNITQKTPLLFHVKKIDDNIKKLQHFLYKARGNKA